MDNEQPPFLPRAVDDVGLIFPTSVTDYLPPWDEIPEEFRRFGGTQWNKLVSDWFFSGLTDLNLTPKDGIDEALALRHVKYVMGSWEPKHEHKEAGCAYLLSMWFTDPKWTVKGRAS